MKKTYLLLAALAAACASLTLPLQAAQPDPGLIDFGTWTPSGDGAEFVEVRIQNNLIAMAARLARSSEPEVADLLGGLRYVRVNVMGLTDDNRSEVTERVAALRARILRRGWDQIVTVKEQGGEEVGVFVKLRGDEAVEGVVVIVQSGDDEVVLVNVAGDIQPEKLAVLGERFDIEPLKELGMKTKRS